jgi:hypothetical protein
LKRSESEDCRAVAWRRRAAGHTLDMDASSFDPASQSFFAADLSHRSVTKAGMTDDIQYRCERRMVLLRGHVRVRHKTCNLLKLFLQRQRK